ncbi:MAG: hypothetical protein GY754_07730 [bacterium]|nr:hypothetical protein [bacterium]
MSQLTEITAFIKSTVSELGAHDMKKPITAEYQKLRLMNSDSSWKDPQLEEISEFLLPGDLSNKKVNEFIDRIASAARENEYLIDFLNRPEIESFKNYINIVKKEGPAVLPGVLAYALLLDRLTSAMHEDWRLIDVCKKMAEISCIGQGKSKIIKNFYSH